MVHELAAVLWLQFMVHVMLFPMINVLYFTQVLSEVCVLTRLFSAVPCVVPLRNCTRYALVRLSQRRWFCIRISAILQQRFEDSMCDYTYVNRSNMAKT
jgi:hypothetical protein